MTELALPTDVEIAVEIVLLLASPLHRYEGRPADGALPFDGEEARSSIQVKAGLGIVGDRFFGRPAHKNSAVTFMAAESIDHVRESLGVPADPANARRNIVLRGIDIDSMRGVAFSLDSGHGPVLFQAHRPSPPCAWMDVQLAPGAFKALRGRGGMRCEPLSDGILSLGPAVLKTS